ncbi:hypothetical protein MMA231_03025 [Asticcacaulis sp. MM231]|uniref:phytanoyl-CoA dioxygenase family protein n=1 Tax=Asticcacaulis sp. MM231 TaxID=3157666 RepID=UPI0032D5A285
MTDGENVVFSAGGAALYPAILAPEEVQDLAGRMEALISGRPGKRLVGMEWDGLVDAEGRIGRIAAGLIGMQAKPVRVAVLDKTVEANWSVAWHQDRTIALRERIETDGFGPWSTKDGICHVAPPVSLLAGMVTLRVHLDDCPADNAPLKVALGSHVLGFVAADRAARVAEAHPILSCLAEAGDIWAYSTLILHASERAQKAGRRRVLQVDYAAEDLPGNLEWRGLD